MNEPNMALVWEEKRRRRAIDFQRRLHELYDAIPGLRELDAEYRSVYAGAIGELLQKKGTKREILERAEVRRMEIKGRLDALLASHGYPEDSLEDKPDCPVCGDYGYIGGEMCTCMRREAEALRTASLSRTLAVRSFDDFRLDIFSAEIDPEYGFSQRDNMSRIKNKCRAWAEHLGPHSPNLFLNGGTGQGKTYLCSCMAGVCVAGGFSVVYDTVIHTLACLEDKKFDRGGDPDPYFRCDLLILDDLGTEMLTAFAQSALYDLINTRLMQNKKSIINSNLLLDAIRERYLPQIASRLEGEYELISFFGPDIRTRRKGFYL